MEALKQRFNTWYNGLESREQYILIGGGISLAIMLLYFAMWSPLNEAVDNLRSKVSRQQNDLHWMISASQQAKSLKASNPQKAQNAGRSLLSIVDQTIKTANLKSALERMEPEGKNSVKLWMKQSSFNSLIQLLGALEAAHGIVVKSINITPGETGLVETRLSLTNESL